VTKLGLGVNKQKIAPATWADNLSNFLFLIYFEKMGQSFLKTKISFNKYYLRLFTTPKSSL